ncbi:MAG: hypothetical protein ABR518_00800, partial [Actinomycetota bacterium]
ASAANVRREFSELVRRGLETSFGPGVYLEIVAGAAALAAIGFGAAVARRKAPGVSATDPPGYSGALFRPQERREQWDS